MRTQEKVALIFGASVLGAAGVAFYRGRRGQDLLLDTALHGVVVGTAITVVGWLVLDSGELSPVVALTNTASEGMGAMPQKAIELLCELDVDQLYSNLKENGVKIAESPANASIVLQDAT